MSDPSRRLPLPDDVLGPYRVRRVLGRGGMGVVLGAEHTGLEREVALKVLPPELGQDEEYRARFLSEARTLARLDSPHVVTIHDAGEIDGLLYLAMHLVPDGDLAGLVRGEGPLPLGVALDVVHQVASGLADAHAAGVLHRDIKASNVLLRRRPGGRLQAYLCDFGIAQVDDAQHTRTGAVVGTWAYLAPERHDGAPASPATDLYALGCLLWVALTGRTPYDGGTEWQVALAHRSEPVPQLPDDGTDPRVARTNALLRDLLAKDPAARPADAADVVRRLDGLLVPPLMRGNHDSVTSTEVTRSSETHISGETGDEPTVRAAVSPTAEKTPSAPGAPAAPGGPHGSGRGRRRLLLAGAAALVVAVGIALAVVLPGDDAPEGRDAEPTAGADPAAYRVVAPGTYGEVTVQLGSDAIEYAGEYRALDEGFVADAGFTGLELLPQPANVEQRVVDGTADIGISSAVAAAVAVDRGDPLTVVATTLTSTPLAVLSLADGADVREVADLVGLRVGVQDSNRPMFDRLLEVNGVDPAQVEVVPVDLDPAVLADGDVDAVVGFTTDQVPTLTAEGYDVAVVEFADAGVAFPSLAIVVRDDYLAAQRDAVEAFLVAVVRGWRVALERPVDETVALVRGESGQTGKGAGSGDDAARDALALQAVLDRVEPDGTLQEALLLTSGEQQEQVVAAAAVLGYDVAADELFDLSVLQDVYARYPELR